MSSVLAIQEVLLQTRAVTWTVSSPRDGRLRTLPCLSLRDCEMPFATGLLNTLLAVWFSASIYHANQGAGGTSTRGVLRKPEFETLKVPRGGGKHQINNLCIFRDERVVQPVSSVPVCKGAPRWARGSTLTAVALNLLTCLLSHSGYRLSLVSGAWPAACRTAGGEGVTVVEQPTGFKYPKSQREENVKTHHRSVQA